MVRRSDRKVSTKGTAKDPRLAAEPTAFKKLWQELVQRCLRAEKPLKITPSDYKRLIAQACVYCGSPPMTMTTYAAGPNFLYNGVDRIDNARGYVLENLAPCCRLCNQFKSKLGVDEFLKHVARIHGHQLGIVA